MVQTIEARTMGQITVASFIDLNLKEEKKQESKRIK
jgi:hypothetical protein